MKRTVLEMTLGFVEITLFTVGCGAYGVLLVVMYLGAVWLSGLLGPMVVSALVLLVCLGMGMGTGKTLLLGVSTIGARGLKWAHDCLTGPLYKRLGEEQHRPR